MSEGGGVRDAQVEKAVQFLSRSKGVSTRDQQIFLRQKGLSVAEIQAAFVRAFGAGGAKTSRSSPPRGVENARDVANGDADSARAARNAEREAARQERKRLRRLKRAQEKDQDKDKKQISDQAEPNAKANDEASDAADQRRRERKERKKRKEREERKKREEHTGHEERHEPAKEETVKGSSSVRERLDEERRKRKMEREERRKRKTDMQQKHEEKHQAAEQEKQSSDRDSASSTRERLAEEQSKRRAEREYKERKERMQRELQNLQAGREKHTNHAHVATPEVDGVDPGEQSHGPVEEGEGKQDGLLGEVVGAPGVEENFTAMESDIAEEVDMQIAEVDGKEDDQIVGDAVAYSNDFELTFEDDDGDEDGDGSASDAQDHAVDDAVSRAQALLDREANRALVPAAAAAPPANDEIMAYDDDEFDDGSRTASPAVTRDQSPPGESERASGTAASIPVTPSALTMTTRTDVSPAAALPPGALPASPDTAVSQTVEALMRGDFSSVDRQIARQEAAKDARRRAQPTLAWAGCGERPPRRRLRRHEAALLSQHRAVTSALHASLRWDAWQQGAGRPTVADMDRDLYSLSTRLAKRGFGEVAEAQATRVVAGQGKEGEAAGERRQPSGWRRLLARPHSAAPARRLRGSSSLLKFSPLKAKRESDAAKADRARPKTAGAHRARNADTGAKAQAEVTETAALLARLDEAAALNARLLQTLGRARHLDGNLPSKLTMLRTADGGTHAVAESAPGSPGAGATAAVEAGATRATAGPAPAPAASAKAAARDSGLMLRRQEALEGELRTAYGGLQARVRRWLDGYLARTGGGGIAGVERVAAPGRNTSAKAKGKPKLGRRKKLVLRRKKKVKAEKAEKRRAERTANRPAFRPAGVALAAADDATKKQNKGTSRKPKQRQLKLKLSKRVAAAQRCAKVIEQEYADDEFDSDGDADVGCDAGGGDGDDEDEAAMRAQVRRLMGRIEALSAQVTKLEQGRGASIETPGSERVKLEG